jgi:hypothetical protein
LNRTINLNSQNWKHVTRISFLQTVFIELFPIINPSSQNLKSQTKIEPSQKWRHQISLRFCLDKNQPWWSIKFLCLLRFWSIKLLHPISVREGNSWSLIRFCFWVGEVSGFYLIFACYWYTMTDYGFVIFCTVIVLWVCDFCTTTDYGF